MAHRSHLDTVGRFSDRAADYAKSRPTYPAEAVRAILEGLGPPERLVAAFRDALAPYEVIKGTIRFPLSEPVPVKLIEGIAKFRAKEVAEREKAKAAAPKKR